MSSSVLCRLAVAVPLILAAGPLAAQTTVITVSRSAVSFTDSLGPASVTRTFPLGAGPLSGAGLLASGPLAYRLLAFRPLSGLPLAGEGVGLPLVGLRSLGVVPFDGSLVSGRTPGRLALADGAGAARADILGPLSPVIDEASALDRLATAVSYRIAPRAPAPASAK
ncbi:hypothetical protein [Arenibaculum sp.]|jgi:hypothetical protein|uniref:hypothetical protein n=1 Tax=Arenibaculum sp. TaxID=2865862 RepID=UPI002E13353C|nr:hypothetical protein [Arenibaculum sp.]